MAPINIVDVKKNYGSVPVVKGISLAVEDGEFIVLVGPSGCGKSTLLRMIAGLESITGGQVEIDGRNVNKAEPAERDIAMVFQNYALYPHMTVRGNLEYGLKNRGTPRAEIDRRVKEAADILEIGPMLDRKPRELSGGQRQRVAMGRAIVREPAAFLFDEPLSNLDAKLRVQMRVEIRRLQRRLRTTSIYVTHDQLEAMTLADRLVVMNGGLVEQVGTPVEVYDRPASLFVAGFIGSPPMNLVPIEVLGVADAGDALALPDETDIVGLRPDALLISKPAEPSVRLNAIVELLEPIGGESHLHVRLGEGQQTVVLTVQGRPDFAETAGIEIFARIDQIHPFNSKTGRRTD
ncbi:sn-glycerol-3-phosphate ABC transporter ATP-binding protein UgpC [Rhizobium bangladeshense]|uniref:Sn-glycerol-3-phosphate ABC transporter ATP-binding protein UgpC n=1 Tax=Rhizobium bangladeshense TaxID=1138189 RepID=A0ABS7LN52_9HYPH|nr:sn-glycerol-3-phosphate ABC transporter ATP-binding protein UgpC [Rhizobium bangladeshense]MBX4870073.1 sn-glycerol-3-phosphate ABC transporter ATP-binding protein UgpC [Rhizobium bangladeshense]MBX4886395.1 sn-glycerol-3-phosphate ABC transporter ATP-binding protein UgpC [Rhizobium bangladeshense]MBX4904728.1 sn-glycerol-3-phosphate ABC transporter ATP-binding protein UgpC [Rhizobium bangladeshense]MBX4916892.1 sn-glycerol-3-phosphate ABC transporter ATP-binding protein UgpC [Rhizobium bang